MYRTIFKVGIELRTEEFVRTNFTVHEVEYAEVRYEGLIIHVINNIKTEKILCKTTIMLQY